MLYEYILAVVFLLNTNAAPLPIESAKDSVACETQARRKAMDRDVVAFLNRPDVASQGGALACLKIELPRA